jgi:hypothetical protein
LAINSEEGVAKEQVKSKWEDAIGATAHVLAGAEGAGYIAAQLRVRDISVSETKAKEDVAGSHENLLTCLSSPLRNDINAFQPSARVDVLGMTKHQVHSSTNRFSMFANYNSDGKDMWVQNGKIERLYAGFSAESPTSRRMVNNPGGHPDRVDELQKKTEGPVIS